MRKLIYSKINKEMFKCTLIYWIYRFQFNFSKFPPNHFRKIQCELKWTRYFSYVFGNIDLINVFDWLIYILCMWFIYFRYIFFNSCYIVIIIYHLCILSNTTKKIKIILLLFMIMKFFFLLATSFRYDFQEFMNFILYYEKIIKEKKLERVHNMCVCMCV